MARWRCAQYAVQDRPSPGCSREDLTCTSYCGQCHVTPQVGRSYVTESVGSWTEMSPRVRVVAESIATRNGTRCTTGLISACRSGMALLLPRLPCLPCLSYLSCLLCRAVCQRPGTGARATLPHSPYTARSPAPGGRPGRGAIHPDLQARYWPPGVDRLPAKCYCAR